LKGINVGYDAADGGYGDFDIVASQNVIGFQNLSLAKSGLEYICASYNQLEELDLSEMSAIKFIELYKCVNLTKINLGSHPALERLCVEDCDLDSLDISGCVALEDLRAALNNYRTINWGSAGQNLWHICIRDNPQMTENLPGLTQFPALKELFIWNTNQTGSFVCNNPVISEIDAYDNNYSGADLSGCTGLKILSLSSSKLSTLDLGTANNLYNIQLRNCELSVSQVDYILQTLDAAGRSNGYLDITANTPPSSDGLINLYNLKARGWSIEYVTAINETADKPYNKITVTGREIKIWLSDNYIYTKAELYDLNGRLVSTKSVESEILVFDISSQPSGLYFVTISNGKEKLTKKIIKP